MPKCKVCGTRVPEGTAQCPMCGTQIIQSRAETQPYSPPKLVQPAKPGSPQPSQSVRSSKPASQTSHDASPAPNNTGLICKACGNTVSNGAVFCIMCGARLIKASASSSISSEQTKNEGVSEASSFVKGSAIQKNIGSSAPKPSGSQSKIKFKIPVIAASAICAITVTVLLFSVVRKHQVTADVGDDSPDVSIFDIRYESGMEDSYGIYENELTESCIEGNERKSKSNNIPSDFIFVEGGTFQMGSNDGYDNEKPVHSVTVSSFYMCDHEVTQKEYREVMMGSNPSYFRGDNRPVEQVRWIEAINYCNTRSQKEDLIPCYTSVDSGWVCNFKANGYRLPTEAEWEYAARGGKKSNGYKYSGSDNLESVAWYDDSENMSWHDGNSGSRTHDVKTKAPNELGLYDMSGNVWEWCWDRYGAYSSSSQTNPVGASSGADRVKRGGCGFYGSYGCSVTYRASDNPLIVFSDWGIGFRVVRSGIKYESVEASIEENENISEIQNISARNCKESKSNNIPSDFIFVDGGTFQMGSTDGDDDEIPVHSVTVSSFYMCTHEVTQKEYREVMGKNPSNEKGDRRPVEQVTWFDAIEYCNKLSKKERLTQCYTQNGGTWTCNFNTNGYRLPTEAEWEYAARGGKRSNGYKYSGGNYLDSVAWYFGNTGFDNTFNVTTKFPNELELYDMSGNVEEWCWDWYHEYPSSPQTNPLGASSGLFRVARGGSYIDDAYDCRVATRSLYIPSNTDNYLGFRVVRSVQ